MFSDTAEVDGIGDERVDGIKTAAAAICAVSAGGALICGIFGGTVLRRQLRLLLDIILAIVLTAPFAGGGTEAEIPEVCTFDMGEYNYSQELYKEALREQTAENIAELLRQQIEAAGIECGEIEPEVNISEDMSIDIERVVLTAEDYSAAAEIVKDSLGADTEVADGAERATQAVSWE